MYSRMFKINGYQKNTFSFLLKNLNACSLAVHERKTISKTNHICHKNFTMCKQSKYSFEKQTRTMADARNKLDIQIMNMNDKENLLEFLKPNFFAGEPLNQYLKLLENPSSLKALSEYSTKNIGQGVSLLARNHEGEIAGVCLNSVRSKDDPAGHEVTEPIFGKIEKLLGYADQEANVFAKFPDVNKVICIDIISVDSKFQGKGIAKMLMDKTRDLARKQGIKLLRVDCTSEFSARASARLGMDCVYELKYADYKENGVQVFNPEPPHTGVRVYVQRLDA